VTVTLEWLGQFELPICPPGSSLDPFTRVCVSPTQGPVAPVPVATPAQTPVVIVPSTSEEKRNATLLWAAAIVSAGIVAAVVLR